MPEIENFSTGTLRNEFISTNTSYYLDPFIERVDVIEKEDSIEFIYIETPLTSICPSIGDNRKVFKIIFSCVKGKWNKSDKIYGKIIPPGKEEYIFED